MNHLSNAIHPTPMLLIKSRTTEETDIAQTHFTAGNDMQQNATLMPLLTLRVVNVLLG